MEPESRGNRTLRLAQRVSESQMGLGGSQSAKRFLNFKRRDGEPEGDALVRVKGAASAVP
jgi:hypothetical protein